MESNTFFCTAETRENIYMYFSHTYIHVGGFCTDGVFGLRFAANLCRMCCLLMRRDLDS